jgi:hypothetical protein
MTRGSRERRIGGHRLDRQHVERDAPQYSSIERLQQIGKSHDRARAVLTSVMPAAAAAKKRASISPRVSA